MNSESLNISFGEVFVKFSQMENSQHDAEKVDQDPDSIENVMSVRTLSSSEWLNYFKKQFSSSHLNKGARGFIHDSASIGSQSSAEKCGSKIDSNTCKPETTTLQLYKCLQSYFIFIGKCTTGLYWLQLH